MSDGDRPASARADRVASAAIARVVRPDFLVKAVRPIPTIATVTADLSAVGCPLAPASIV
jgi:hypothetical protein